MPSMSAKLEGACYRNGASMPGIRLWYAAAAFGLYLYPGCPPCASERMLSVAARSFWHELYDHVHLEAHTTFFAPGSPGPAAPWVQSVESGHWSDSAIDSHSATIRCLRSTAVPGEAARRSLAMSSPAMAADVFQLDLRSTGSWDCFSPAVESEICAARTSSPRSGASLGGLAPGEQGGIGSVG